MDQGQKLFSLPAVLGSRVVPLLVAAVGSFFAAISLRGRPPRWLAATAWTLFAVFCLAAAGLAGTQFYQAQRAATREALALRVDSLTERALAPGSTLSCLDSMAGEGVESACEKQLFAQPQNVAAAVAYTTSRLALLQDAFNIKPLNGADRLDRIVARLQRGLEVDRFGFVAHVLSARYGCKVDTCAQFALLSDASVVKINLQAGTYDSYVTKYQPGWLQDKGPAVALTDPENKLGTNARASLEPNAPRAADGQQKPPTAHEVKDPIDFPSADEIPPVSIMDPEPASGPLQGAKEASKEIHKPAAPHESAEKKPNKAERPPPLPRSNPKAASKTNPKPQPASPPAPADAAQ
jgi:hypothetical protein